MKAHFCIRDDDTSFFTSPGDLEKAYGNLSKRGPISLAIVPFHRAGTSKGVPERFRRRWSVHPLHDNKELVEYLRTGIAANRFEAMLHGYYHDEEHLQPEFSSGKELSHRVTDGRKYLEDLLSTSIRVFVPPKNCIGRDGLRAIAAAGLHLGGSAGVRAGWSPLSPRTWSTWRRLRRWRRAGGLGCPWILDLGDHREIPGNAVTPVSLTGQNEAVFEEAVRIGGSFCAATHYWELNTPSVHPGEPVVGEQLHRLINLAVSSQQVVWQSVGDVVSNGAAVI
jgi:hypothetical protein